MIEIAGVLALSGRDAKDQNEMAAAVKRWLLEHDRWLLIADNADDTRRRDGRRGGVSLLM
jgi:hypothetical protein